MSPLTWCDLSGSITIYTLFNFDEMSILSYETNLVKLRCSCHLPARYA